MGYGKIPGHPDFVRFNAAGQEITALDRWLQEGLFHARRSAAQQWEAAYRAAPVYRFVFALPRGGRFLTGLLQPSRDTVGRKFPFLLALTVERVDWVPAAAGYFEAFYGQARSVLDAAASGLPGQEVGSLVAALESPLPDVSVREDLYLRFLREETLDTLCTALWGDYDVESKDLTFGNLVEILLHLRRHQPSRLTLGLRFPLSGRPAHVPFEVRFWVETSLRLLGRPDLAPTCFWTGDEAADAPALFLFFEPPVAKNLLPLLNWKTEVDTLCDLATEGPGRLAVLRQTLDQAAPGFEEARYRSLDEVQRLLTGTEDRGPRF